MPLDDGDPLQMVVGGDKAVAMIYLHAVAATPGVPAHRPDHAGVGCVNESAAGRGEVLTPVELPGQSREGVNPPPERRAWNQHLKRRVKFPGGRPVKGTRSDVVVPASVLVQGLDRRPLKGQRGVIDRRRRCQ